MRYTPAKTVKNTSTEEIQIDLNIMIQIPILPSKVPGRVSKLDPIFKTLIK